MKGRKIRRLVNKIGRKIAHKGNKIGRKLTKIAGVASRLAPIAGMALGPEAGALAGVVSEGIGAVGRGLQSKSTKDARAAKNSLVDTYQRHRAARGS